MNGFFSDPMLIVLALGIGVALLCLFLAFGDDSNKQQAKRVDRLKSRGQGGPIAKALQLRRDAGDKGKISQLVLRYVPRPELLRERLHRTGRSISLGAYGVGCLVVGLIGAGVALMMGLSLLLALPAAFLAGLWLPHLFIGFLAQRRANLFGKHFPEAVALMVRGLKSGLPITETFQIAGNEVPDPVGGEFRQVSDQIRLGHPPEQALWDAAKRVGTPELKFLVVTLSIQRETGGNLAETLENLDNILRRRRQMKLKVRAMSSEARASAMIIGALPFIMMGVLTLVNSAYISLLFTTERGHHMLMAAAGSLSLGVAIMTKMVKFDI
ncbi:MAG TPA: type II secretion system F family protein [Stellaceae bacterium]|nr:type II secretion system F family protein [Stellaceae bacterium]